MVNRDANARRGRAERRQPPGIVAPLPRWYANTAFFRNSEMPKWRTAMADATVPCPHCKAPVTLPVGQVGRCPSCNGEVRVHAVGTGEEDEALEAAPVLRQDRGAGWWDARQSRTTRPAAEKASLVEVLGLKSACRWLHRGGCYMHGFALVLLGLALPADPIELPRDVGAGPAPKVDRFQSLPKGWSVTATVVAPEHQLAAFSQKLGGQVVRISNTTLGVGGQQLKVNVVDCKTDEDAAKVHEALLRVHKDNHAACPREGKSVVEFVSKEPRLIERAYQDLGFKRTRVTYQVSFQAAPIEKCDYMAWNKMYNAFLNRNEALIRDLSKSFTFGAQISVRAHGLGSEKSSFSFTPRPRDSKLEAEGDITTYSFADLPRKHGLPEVGVVVAVTSEAFAMTPTKRKAGPELLGPNEFWPSDDPEIVALAKQITEGKTGSRDKTAAVLDWLMPGKNTKYGGPITGSRYGVKKVLKQGFGHCWDFSDCFVTLCRAAGVPSRQVLGWLHGESGHVWAEVLLEGEGWRQVDPTAGMGCDCRYIPYIASENGKTSIVYISPVDIKLKR